jgi:hypothetical protein
VKITCISTHKRVTCDRAALLTPALREAARVETNAWIKRLRLVRYDGTIMRERFTYRNESLWWFTELYLHKRRQLDEAVETILALGAAQESGALEFNVGTSDRAGRLAAVAFGQATGSRVTLQPGRSKGGRHTWPSLLVGAAGRLHRFRRGVRHRRGHPRVAAFVHTAFWRTADPQQETYIGPILDALIAATSASDVAFVGLGPRRNFRARRWWDPVTPASAFAAPVTPIERFASAHTTRGSGELFKQRHRLALTLTSGEAIRAAAVVRGCDLWPVLAHELEGAAMVQWPWSARTMDEAGAALDALEPRATVTYAEAGAWGRALMLESRRRGIPSVGIQHGFIYRHWLNYLHEPDEMADDGFPRPDRTLIYDRYAAEHLVTRGHFPETSLVVTGSARLENLVAQIAEARGHRDRIRQRLGARPTEKVAVLAAKFSEIRGELPAVVGATSRLRDLRLIIKPHPAETADVYAPDAGGRSQVTISPSSSSLSDLLTIADVVVTMNSTVAIDALVLGIPAVVVGLPNNLTPFVDAGVMLGANTAEEIERALQSVLYDRQVQQALAGRAGAYAARYGLAPEPGAAARAAREILSLAKDY